MGMRTDYRCTTCDARFTAGEGGGFFFDLLHCTDCGAAKSISHQDMGDIHLAFIKGLPVPYAMVRARLDARIKATFPGEPLDGEAYHEAVSKLAGPCTCGGTFTYEAPARCPGCRSTQESWEPTGGWVHYD